MNADTSNQHEQILPPGCLSTQALVAHCKQEISEYQKCPSDFFALSGCYSYELCYRAIALHDEVAWQGIYLCYEPFVYRAIRIRQAKSSLLQREGSDALVNATFAKMALSLTKERLQLCHSLARLLCYLQRCIQSVICNVLRAGRGSLQEASLNILNEEPDCAAADELAISNVSLQEVWSVVQEELHGEAERVLIYLSYIQDMDPRDISFHYRHLFPTINHVYQTKSLILRRLRRNELLRKRLIAHRTERDHQKAGSETKNFSLDKSV